MKQRLKYLITNQWLFLVCWLLLVATMSVALALVPKYQLHLALNTNIHSTGLDLFFFYFTKIAEYLPYIITFLLLFYKYSWAIFAALGQLGATLTTQILKHIINAPRPKTYFETNFPDLIPQLHWVEGVNMHSWFSFPSGHTTAFFAMFFLLSLLACDNYRPQKSISQAWLIQFLCFALATLGGYSRIYLSQHFTADVLAGTIVGVLLTSVFYIIPWPWNKSWADKSIIG